MGRGVLWEVQLLSEVVLAFEEVGQALVGDVEEVDEGLHIARLQQVRADALARVVLVLLGCHCAGRDLAGLVTLCPLRLFVSGCLVEQGGCAHGLHRLLDRLDLLLLLLALH